MTHQNCFDSIHPDPMHIPKKKPMTTTSMFVPEFTKVHPDSVGCGEPLDDTGDGLPEVNPPLSLPGETNVTADGVSDTPPETPRTKPSDSKTQKRVRASASDSDDNEASSERVFKKSKGLPVTPKRKRTVRATDYSAESSSYSSSSSSHSSSSFPSTISDGNGEVFECYLESSSY